MEGQKKRQLPTSMMAISVFLEMCATEGVDQKFTYFFCIPLFIRKQQFIVLFSMYWSLASLHFFQNHFYYSASFRQQCSIPSTLFQPFSEELRREDHSTSPRSSDIYSTIIGPFYFIHFNIFFLPYKLQFVIISHPKHTLHTKFTTPCSPIHARRSPLAALHSHASNPHINFTVYRKAAECFV